VADYVRSEGVGELTLKGFHRPVAAFSVSGRIGLGSDIGA